MRSGKQAKRHENLSLDAENLPNDPRLTVPNFADELDLDGEGDIWEKRLVILPEALERLKPKQRDVIIMRFIKKMTLEQISRKVGRQSFCAQDD